MIFPYNIIIMAGFSTSALVLTGMTFLVLVVMIISVIEMSKHSRLDNISTYADPLPPMCSSFPPNPQSINCLEYLQTCQADYYNDEVTTKNKQDTMQRNIVLGKSKLAVMPDGMSLESCTIPIDMFPMFELDKACGDGSKFKSKDIGCMVPLRSQNVRKKDALAGIHVVGPGLKKTVRTDALMDVVKAAYERMIDGGTPPRESIFTALSSRPTLPRKEQFPDLSDVIAKYQIYYNDKLQNFQTLPTRYGYIMGKIYMTADMKPVEEGIVTTIPIIQKRIDNRYYTLIYRYTTEAFLSLECNNLAEWFLKDPEAGKPSQKMDLVTDPIISFVKIEDFLAHKIMQYRSQYLIEVLKKNKSRFSIIIEVGNQFNKDPLLTIELTKYSVDMEDGDDIGLMKFFSKGRIVERYTSNKRLFMEQFDVSTFKINCGQEHAWTIGYTQEKGVSCQNHNVFMTIPTGKKCPWQGWFKGCIIVSNDAPVNIAGPIKDFDEFKRKNVGQWMNVWMCAENGDPFQDIQIVPGLLPFNPYAFREVFIRKEGQSDESWALFIWKTISLDGDTARYSEVFKKLLENVKDKNILDFKDYEMACNAALSNLQYTKAAVNMGCLGPPIIPKDA